jgi:ABC-type multidrug transport system ATPase subunit
MLIKCGYSALYFNFKSIIENMNISKNLKKEILKQVLDQDNPFGVSEERSIMSFLDRVWELDIMLSEDRRFSDAYEDIEQHIVNNNDWSYEYLFEERLGLLNDNKAFQKFLELLLNPDFRDGEDEIMMFYLLINPYLEKENYTFTIVNYEVGLPIYEVKSKNDVADHLVGIKVNEIPFFVIWEPNGHNHRFDAHEPPPGFPSFVLAFNDTWNDFQLKTDFYLFYYESEENSHQIGSVKIMHAHNDTQQVLGSPFVNLSDDFCTLGQTYGYYEKLKELLGKDFESVLWALKDAAFFPEINDKFEKHSVFKTSLIRYDEQEQLLREAKYRVYDYNLSNLYSFKYNYLPKFSKTALDIEFNFDNNEDFPNRIYALIGKNGTGKTQLMNSLPLDISKKDDSKFMPRTPLFSKVISVSYSVFDNFKIPEKTATFNYLFCGLRDKKGKRLTESQQSARFHKAWRRIKLLDRMPRWNFILQNFLDKEILDLFIVLDEDGQLDVSVEGFKKARRMLSSGQGILLYIITEIVANIRYDSIILYDEPETHLHPNAISQLMNTIYDLVNTFQSYCIIATHSPLVIRELLSRNVYVIEKEGSVPSVRKLSYETFGENLTVLTDDIFGNREVPKQYKKILNDLVRAGNDYDSILDIIESDNVPLSLNARLYLKTIVNEKS